MEMLGYIRMRYRRSNGGRGLNFSPIPLATTGFGEIKKGTSVPNRRDNSRSRSSLSLSLRTLLSVTSVPAAFPLPPPNPAPEGIFLRRRIFMSIG